MNHRREIQWRHLIDAAGTAVVLFLVFLPLVYLALVAMAPEGGPQ